MKEIWILWKKILRWEESRQFWFYKKILKCWTAQRLVCDLDYVNVVNVESHECIMLINGENMNTIGYLESSEKNYELLIMWKSMRI